MLLDCLWSAPNIEGHAKYYANFIFRETLCVDSADFPICHSKILTSLHAEQQYNMLKCMIEIFLLPHSGQSISVISILKS